MNAVVQQMNKLEPFSELLAGRYSYLSDVESNPVSYPTQVQAEHVETPLPKDENEVVARDDNPTDDDNFGEIIKKSMVETVSAWARRLTNDVFSIQFLLRVLHQI